MVVENGSNAGEVSEFFDICKEFFPGSFGIFGEDRETWGNPAESLDCVIVKAALNLGCVLGHNLAFDMCKVLADDEHYNIVMFDTDVEVYDEHWLSAVKTFVDNSTEEIGIVGLEHSASEKCAGAVALDTSGNWSLYPGQTDDPTPVKCESVGLGMAFLAWPTPKHRFDGGFILYYKQDDDLCFQVRADGYSVWAYPIDMVHWGSRGLQTNGYAVNDTVRGRESFDVIKRTNQKYFASKWSWALRGRRRNLAEEAKHLETMEAMFYERRISNGKA